MAKSRKVSYEEKLEIVKWTIEHNHEYKLAAEKFETAYSQVYNWVRKYNAEGETGLKDERGKRKPVENLSEIEKLKREVELLRRRNERLEMEAEVIKKFQEIERRDILARSAKKPNTKR
jgi:transposase-like protein